MYRGKQYKNRTETVIFRTENKSVYFFIAISYNF